jgi:4-amino-4-deoxy-L-arabinose transferase-like glycosyltransferase
VSTSAARRALPLPRAAIAGAAVAVRAAPEPAVLAVAAALRLSDLERVPGDPYYDAAVRTMGGSWQAFLAGAFEPGRRVAVDKPAPGLWPQVLSTQLFGFHTWALLLPAALGGVAAVAAVMWVARMIAGRWAGVAAGAALAVLPAAVVTARSDTMDAVMAALAVCAFGLALRAARSGGLALLAASGALAGLAFEVKLVEALVPAAAVLLAWLLAGRARRWVGAALWCAAFVACALSWFAAVAVIPLHPRPWALGSSNGSPFNAALVYDGIDRLLPSARPQGAAPVPVAAARCGSCRPAGTSIRGSASRRSPRWRPWPRPSPWGPSPDAAPPRPARPRAVAYGADPFGAPRRFRLRVQRGGRGSPRWSLGWSRGWRCAARCRTCGRATSSSSIRRSPPCSASRWLAWGGRARWSRSSSWFR